MKEHRFSAVLWTVMVLLYLSFVYTPFVISKAASQESFIKGDCYYYRAVIVSLLEDGDLLLENNVSLDPLNGQLAIGQDGLVPKHPIIMSLVSMPFYFLAGTPGLLLFNILDCMILMVLVFKLNCLFYDRLIAFITTMLYATGTLFLEYTYNYSPDVFSSVLLLAGLYLALRGRLYVSAALLGLSVFAKIPNAPLAGIILLYAGLVMRREKAGDDSTEDPLRDRVMRTILAAAVFVLALVPLAYTNYRLFGSPLITGYQRTAIADPTGSQALLDDHVNKFNQPLLKGVYQTLFHPSSGVVLTNPVLILAFLGVFRIRSIREQDEVYLILLVGLVQFVFFAKYDLWYTSHFSNRFLMTFVALFSVFTGNFLRYFSLKFSLGTSLQEHSFTHYHIPGNSR